jgi:hypothetical protein
MLPVNINSAQAAEALQKIPTVEFESSFNSPWYNFPAELVRDELVRRLKLRIDLSVDAKKVKYKEIIDRYRTVGKAGSMDRLIKELSEIEESHWEPFSRTMEASKARIEEMNAHFRQWAEIHSQRDDPFEGKAKPGDWRPDGTELCPVCGGDGRGADSRMCGKCGGRGFIRR